MKKLYLISLISILLTALDVVAQQDFEAKKQKVKDVMRHYVDNGLPGIALAFYSEPTGLWSHAEGFANLENKDELTVDHLHYLQSVSKMYMAVATLKLVEKKKLKLDDTIDSYLIAIDLGKLANQGITIRMLLNHTSGIPDYASESQFVSFVINNFYTPFSVKKAFSFVKDKSLDFEPGSDYAYSNTNYLLLSLIVDEITSNHVNFVNQQILQKADLEQTYYLTPENYLSVENIADSYWDILNIEKPVNVTRIQKVNVASLKGDDGLVCTPADAVKFLRALVNGKILKPKTLQLMQEWVIKDGERKYGLGVTYYDLYVTYALGHSGGGIGAGCVLLYLPELDAYVFLATNFSTMIESKITAKNSDLQQKILEALFL